MSPIFVSLVSGLRYGTESELVLVVDDLTKAMTRYTLLFYVGQ